MDSSPPDLEFREYDDFGDRSRKSNKLQIFVMEPFCWHNLLFLENEQLFWQKLIQNLVQSKTLILSQICKALRIFQESYALSFYRSLNVLCKSNFLSQPENLTAFSAPSKTFVLGQKPILLNVNHLFVWHKMFVTATICK